MNILVIGIGIVVGIFVLYFLIAKILGLRVINPNEVAVVEKWWSFKGSLKDSIISLHGEAGYMPDLLRGGIHFRSMLMYRIHRYPPDHHPAGAGRLYLRPRWCSAFARADPGFCRPRGEQFPGRPGLYHRRRPEGPAARHAERGYIRHQPLAVHRHYLQ